MSKKTITCSTCGGRGTLPDYGTLHSDPKGKTKTCLACNGLGHTWVRVQP
jgi:DnaJ-class molecular chaperone